MSTDATEHLGLEIGNDDYHAMPGVSSSKLKDFADDPRLYWYRYLSGQYRQPAKQHFDFGTAVHDICLLGTKANVAIIPNDVLAKNGARSTTAYKEWAEENAGKQQLKNHEFEAVLRCVDSVQAHPIASQLLRAPGVCERAFVYDDPNLEITLRCKVDKLAQLGEHRPVNNIVVDLKTTATGTTPSKFVKQIVNFKYHYQAYFYKKVLGCCGVEIKSFVFIAVCVDQPHTVDCYSIDDEFLTLAEADVENALMDIAERTRANDWQPRTCNSIIELSPPNYLKYQGDYQL